jgi:hypothetical protein
MRSRVLLVVGLVAAAPSAPADDHHMKPTVRPITQKGQVVGFRVTTVLHKEYGSGPEEGHLHLGRMKLPDGADRGHESRRWASGATPGYARWSSPAIPAKRNQPTEATFEFIYGKGNDFKPGEEVDVYTTWNQSSDPKHPYPHVWGMHDGPVKQGDRDYVIRLPGDPNAHRK